MAASLVLVLWPSVAGLLTGRVLTGLAVGLMASTATAYLSDLHQQAYPEQPGSATPGLVAAVANLGGLALGPLAAGVLAQWAPWPLVTPFALFAAAALVLVVLVLHSPETIDRGAASEVPARFALRPGGGRRFAAAASTGFFSFAVMGFFSSLGAVVVHDVLGISSPLVAGLAPFSVFAASAVAQIALRHLSPGRMLVSGVVLFPAGLTLTAVALFHPTLWLYLTAAAIAGAGAGLLFKASVGQSAGAARPTSPRGRTGRVLRHRLSRHGPALDRLQRHLEAPRTESHDDRLRRRTLRGRHRRGRRLHAARSTRPRLSPAPLPGSPRSTSPTRYPTSPTRHPT